MVDYLVAATLSNLLVSTILAALAWVVQRKIASPGLMNLLWAVVLIKLVTPPIVAIPALIVPSVAGSNIPASAGPVTNYDVGSGAILDKNFASVDSLPNDLSASPATVVKLPSARLSLVVWMVVSVILFAVSAVRILRFHWLLVANARVHQELSRGLGSSVSRQFGLRKDPNILVTSANVAPFVWWMAGRGIIVVSSRATQELDQADLRLIITHEMAHIKRRDHWFRWLEWLALVTFWWNPIMWWARQQLRSSEEMACDQLVLQTSKSEVNQYANSLLNMAELLTSPEIRPPVMASAINSGGSFERRLKVMMSEKTWTAPAALRTAVMAMAMCLFPLGFVYAQDFEAVERRLGGAVEAGELSLEQANLMMEALRRSSAGDRELGARKERYQRFMNDIREAAEAGKLTEEEAEMKLAAVRREMFEAGLQNDRELGEMEAKKQRYMLYMKEIKAAIEAGKLTEEEGEEKLIAVRREMFEQDRHRDAERRELEAKKRRYEQAARQIKEAHEAGKISEEEAEEKLIAMRREMFEQERHQEAEGQELEAKKRRYERAAREIKEAHEAGKISEEEAEAQLIDLRREMFEKERHDENKGQ